MTAVVDSSAVVAALIDSGSAGRWSEDVFASHDLIAPQLVLVEASNILRRAVLARDVSDELASLAYADLLSLRIRLFPYEPFAERVWQLRENLTAYDAWYVSVAEAVGAPLVTLDKRLVRATGPRCDFLVPLDE